MVPLLEGGLQALENLCASQCLDSSQSKSRLCLPYLELDLGLGNILLATTTASNLLRLGNLVSHCIGAEILNGIALDSVDAELGTGLDSCESARDCIGVLSVVIPRPMLSLYPACAFASFGVS